jgi:alkyldihydroxyacetonephosphate synthase
MSAEERKFVLDRYRAKFATDEFDTIAVPGLEHLSLREPRVVPPAPLVPFCTTDRYDRAAHTYGRSYPDYVRAMLGDYNCAPDVVAYPRNEAEISAVMDWTSAVGASPSVGSPGASAKRNSRPAIPRAQSRPRKSAQDDKWSFCLTTAIIAANRRDHEQTTAPEPHTGFQG